MNRVRTVSRVHNRRRSGISMIEVIASTLIVSTILIVSLTASSNLMRNQATVNAGVEGKRLACRFLDEVTSMGFEDPDLGHVFGPEADEIIVPRTSLDDVDDYHGLGLSPPTDRQGEALAGFSGWTVSIQVTPADTTPTGYTEVANFDAPLRQITVVCTSPSGVVTTGQAIVSQTSSTLDTTLAHQRQFGLSVSLAGSSLAGSSNVEVTVPLRNNPSVSGL